MSKRLATTTLVFLTAALLVGVDANACAVCFGDPDSPMTKGMIAGVWVMLGCVGTLLAGFAGMFGYWIYRSYHPHLYGDQGATN